MAERRQVEGGEENEYLFKQKRIRVRKENKFNSGKRIFKKLGKRERAPIFWRREEKNSAEAEEKAGC